MTQPTVVDLFAGSGGFTVAFDRAGYACVGQCEVDPHAMAVLEHHWPEVPKHGDVRTLTVDTFGFADVVTFGSPCQGLSQAGHQRGLDDPRSGLFLEAVRYLDEMQEVSGGESPQWAVWENVAHAFHTSKGADFGAVLSALLKAEVPVPGSGKWADAGVVRGRDRSVCWRVLDAQHFGRPQRRRRIVLVVGFGGRDPAPVLLERERLRGDPDAGEEAGEGAATAAPGGAGESGARVVLEAFSFKPSHFTRGKDGAPSTIMPPLMADADKGDQDAVVFVRTGPVDDTDGRFVAMRISGQGYWLEDDKTGPLRARDGKDHGAAVIAWTQDGVNADPLMVREGSTYTQEGKVFHMHNVVQVSMDQAMVFDGAQITHPANMTRVSPGGMVSTLAATSKMRVALGDGVRRLTPVEAERLQGFDDGWTDVVVGKKPMADTHRYRLMGNAVNVPVFEWVARRLPV